MTSGANIGEGNNGYTTTRRPGTGRSYNFGSRSHVQVDPRGSYSVPPLLDLDSSWYSADVLPSSQGYHQSYSGFQLGCQEQTSLRTPGSEVALRSSSFALSPTPVDDETGPPILGIDVSVAEVDSILREVYNIPNTCPVNLNSIHDPPPPNFTYAALAQIAIWSSPEKRLTLADIYSCLEKKFEHLRNPGTTTKWRGNIRHLLSLKKCFIKSPDKQGSRHFWSLDYRYLKGGDKRERKRGRKTRDDFVNREEEEDIDEGILELDEGDGSSSKDESSTSSSSPSSHYSPVQTFASGASTIASSSDMGMMNIRMGPGYPPPSTRPPLPHYDSFYHASGGRQTLRPGPMIESVPPGRQYTSSSSNSHQSSHSPYYAHAYPPSSFTSTSERPSSFGQSHFPSTAYPRGAT